ncbi:MAG TPA: hypothetical protein VN903_25605 [Polyangia bacterium]|nr:hypothetical protein [Polyangia bacterium]
MPNTETPEPEEQEESTEIATTTPGGSRDDYGWCNCPGGRCTCEERS